MAPTHSRCWKTAAGALPSPARLPPGAAAAARPPLCPPQLGGSSQTSASRGPARSTPRRERLGELLEETRRLPGGELPLRGNEKLRGVGGGRVPPLQRCVGLGQRGGVPRGCSRATGGRGRGTGRSLSPPACNKLLIESFLRVDHGEFVLQPPSLSLAGPLGQRWASRPGVLSRSSLPALPVLSHRPKQGVSGRKLCCCRAGVGTTWCESPSAQKR